MYNHISGGIHHHHYPPSQQEIPFEKRDVRVTLVFTQSEFDRLNTIAEKRGFQLSPFLRHLVGIGIKAEKYLNSTLADILK